MGWVDSESMKTRILVLIIANIILAIIIFLIGYDFGYFNALEDIKESLEKAPTNSTQMENEYGLFLKVDHLNENDRMIL